MIIDKDRIQKAIQEYVEENTPPEDYYSIVEYAEEMFPNENRQRVSAILDAMVRDGKALKSDRKFDDKWYYKILIL